MKKSLMELYLEREIAATADHTHSYLFIFTNCGSFINHMDDGYELLGEYFLMHDCVSSMNPQIKVEKIALCYDHIVGVAVQHDHKRAEQR